MRKRIAWVTVAIMLITVFLSAGAQAANWKTSYRSYLKSHFKVHYYEYVGLMDIGRDGTPEMFYVEQDSHCHNAKLRVVGMVGCKAKIISSFTLGYMMEGLRIELHYNGGQYRCYLYNSSSSKHYKSVNENYYRITAKSSKKCTYFLEYGTTYYTSSNKAVYYVGGKKTTEDAYNSFCEWFENAWVDRNDADIGHIGRYSKLSAVLGFYDEDANNYTMPY
jgi:hypothetical protein